MSYDVPLSIEGIPFIIRFKTLATIAPAHSPNILY